MLGVHASTEYLFFIILSPVGSYYAHGLEPTKLVVEDTYTRANHRRNRGGKVPRQLCRVHEGG